MKVRQGVHRDIETWRQTTDWRDKEMKRREHSEKPAIKNINR